MYRTSHHALRAVYAAAHYWVSIDGHRARVVPLTPWPAGIAGLKGWCAQITAYNPFSRPTSALDNQRAHGELLALLSQSGLAWWPAASSDESGDWLEPGALVVDTSPAFVEALARRFGQYAVLAGDAADVPRLIFYEPAADEPPAA